MTQQNRRERLKEAGFVEISSSFVKFEHKKLMKDLEKLSRTGKLGTLRTAILLELINNWKIG